MHFNHRTIDLEVVHLNHSTFGGTSAWTALVPCDNRLVFVAPLPHVQHVVNRERVVPECIRTSTAQQSYSTVQTSNQFESRLIAVDVDGAQKEARLRGYETSLRTPAEGTGNGVGGQRARQGARYV